MMGDTFLGDEHDISLIKRADDLSPTLICHPFTRAERLIAFAIISRYEKTRFLNRRGCDYTVT